MNISPVSSTPLTIYTRPLEPVSAVRKVAGGASSQLAKAAKNMETFEDTGTTTYNRAMKETSSVAPVGSNISIVV